MPPTGILAVWNNCAPGQEAAYERWYQTEHLIERLSVPGFTRGRRYEAVEAARTYFTYYETDTPDVLQSAAYLEQLDNPTPLTKQIMSGIFTDMSRTVCRRIACRGDMRGAFALTVTSRDPVPGSVWEEGLALAADPIRVTRAELWEAVADDHGEPSAEERLRGGDDRIASCLFVETLREDDGWTLKAKLAEHLSGAPMQVGLYRLVCDFASA